MGLMCSPRIYHYQGWLFECHSYLGYWPLKKNGNPRERAGQRFWELVAQFERLPENKKRQYRVVDGGCQQF